MKKRFWNWWARYTRKTKNKVRDGKTKKLNKIEGHKIRIGSMKSTAKRGTEELRIERINKLNKIEEIETVIKELRTKIKFDELANNVDIILLQGTKKSILQNILAMEKILDQNLLIQVLKTEV